MSLRLKYRRDRRSWRISLVLLTLLVCIFLALHLVGGLEAFPAWFLLFALCLICLCLLSIPRLITLDEEHFQIHCIVELIQIHLEDVEQAEVASDREFRWMVPLLASYGFFGYYGYYLNLKGWRLYRVYATRRRGLVRIKDTYDSTYLVSCDEPQELVDALLRGRDRKREEILRTQAEGTPEQ